MGNGAAANALVLKILFWRPRERPLFKGTTLMSYPSIKRKATSAWVRTAATIAATIAAITQIETAPAADVPRIIDPASKKHYVDHFNATEKEPTLFANAAAAKAANNLASLQGRFVANNAQSWDWMVENVPLLDCPDEGLQEMFYYRWWTYRSHIKNVDRTPYYILTEFWERENAISSGVGHHIMEGRWLQNTKYLDQYLKYWLHDGGNGQPGDTHNFSTWTTWAAYQRYLVTGDKDYIVSLLDDAITDYGKWEREHLAPNGLYWQRESSDAMEEGINGSRQEQFRRPTISSYAYGNAQAIAAIARLTDKEALAKQYDAKAASIKKAVQDLLWDPVGKFFKQQWADGHLSSFREEIGFVPWYFELPDKDKGYEVAWAQLLDPQGFNAPFGITTAERRAPGFRTHGSGHGCEWDGAVWPFSTSHTLTAMANLLNDYPQNVVTKENYLTELQTYAKSQHKDGEPYIGEYLDETTGKWLRNDLERGRHYNHSTYCDLVINGLIGVRPQADNTLVVSPLIPPGQWDFFCLDRIAYHGQMISIIWDKDGRKYNQGAGLTVFADGKQVAHAAELGKVTATLAK
jgi:hypothetical protein